MTDLEELLIWRIPLLRKMSNDCYKDYVTGDTYLLSLATYMGTADDAATNGMIRLIKKTKEEMEYRHTARFRKNRAGYIRFLVFHIGH